MLEFDDIQHILLTRTPALTGRYEFLSFRSASGGRAWLNEILKTVQSAADVLDSVDEDKRWVTRGVHLEWPQGSRRGRNFARHVPGGVQARYARTRRHPR